MWAIDVELGVRGRYCADAARHFERRCPSLLKGDRQWYAADNRRPATNTLERLHIDQAENWHRAHQRSIRGMSGYGMSAFGIELTSRW
jgi:hypothetical protein